MEELVAYITKNLPEFLFVLLRTSVFMSMMPLFSSREHPMMFKAGLVLGISAVLVPVVEINARLEDFHIYVIREIVFGMALGLSVRFVFVAVTMAGQMIATAIALRAGNVFDPEFGASGELSRLLSVLATLLFFALDVHHDMIYVFARSFDMVPMGSANIGALTNEAVALSGRLFVMAVKMSLPVLLGSIIINIIVGFMNKVAPQINMLIISFPIHILTGMFIMLLGVPFFIALLRGYFSDASQEMQRMLVLSKG